MPVSSQLKLLGFLAAYLACCCAAAVEPKLSLDTVLAKWEAASDKCKTLDAKVTEFRYDGVFSPDRPTIQRGRFYYEAPNSGRFQLQSEHGSGWQGLSEAIIWNGEETLVIDGQGRVCQKISWKNWKSGKDVSEDDALGWFVALIHGLEHPTMTYLPLVVDIHGAEIRDRFKLSLEDRGEQILITAVPKKQGVASLYSEIQVLLNAKTWMTHAVQVRSPNHKDYTVIVLEYSKINERPKDRDQLLSPDLHSLEVTELR